VKHTEEIITQKNFCMWMAGGGIKGGTKIGETDDFSYKPG
jgi:hypothetical protein